MRCRIFISYRKEDSTTAANRLYDLLQKWFNPGSLFMDSHTIKPGQEWPESIHTKISESEVVLVLIGTQWLKATVDPNSKSRLHSRTDWVRLEIETAMQQGKKIIPILSEGVKMPKPVQLPQSIRKLTDYQAITLQLESKDWQSAFKDSLHSILDTDRATDSLRESLESILVDKYKIVKLLSVGSRYKVYLAKDKWLERNLAIKVPKDPALESGIRDALRDAVKFDRQVPNSVHIYGAYLDKSPNHIIMDYFDGGTLRKAIDQTEGRGFSLNEVKRLILEIGNSIERAHLANLTHCNIKPSNVLFNSVRVPYLSPLCRISEITQKSVADALLAHGSAVQDPKYREDMCYIAPEIFDDAYRPGSVDVKMKMIDQYMLGLLACELLSGQIPNTVSTIDDIMNAKVQAFNPIKDIFLLRKDCPQRFSDIILRMIDMKPENRYPSIKIALYEIESISFDHVEIAKDSFSRCLANEANHNGFFQTFYEEFIRLCPEAADKFANSSIGKTNHHRQYDLLMEATFMLLMFAENIKSNKEPNVLSRIAKMHGREHLKISGPSYDMFADAFINTVCGNPPHIEQPFDKECQVNSNERKMIEKAWREALKPGIQYMKNAYWT